VELTIEKIKDSIRSGRIGRDQISRNLLSDAHLINSIRKTLFKLGAQDHDIPDVINYTIVQLMKNVLKNPNFHVRSNINSYLCGIARNIWLQKLRARKSTLVEMSETFEIEDEETSIDLIIINDEKKSILKSILERLGHNCKEVLMKWASGYRMKEIAELTGYRSAGVVRKRKYTCMKILADYFEQHPHVKTLLC